MRFASPHLTSEGAETGEAFEDSPHAEPKVPGAESSKAVGSSHNPGTGRDHGGAESYEALSGSHNPETQRGHGGAESYEALSGSHNPETQRDDGGAESYEALGGFGPCPQ